jgi:hypothetical protein
MGNVTLPTPVALAGGGLCLLGGYLLGVLAGPETPSRATATVESYDAARGELCLTGPEAADAETADDSGVLCGLWRRTVGDNERPDPGDAFRFVSVVVEQPEGGDGPLTLIYGDVVG